MQAGQQDSIAVVARSEFKLQYFGPRLVAGLHGGRLRISEISDIDGAVTMAPYD